MSEQILPIDPASGDDSVGFGVDLRAADTVRASSGVR
jgi:hypothetical protein